MCCVNIPGVRVDAGAFSDALGYGRCREARTAWDPIEDRGKPLTFAEFERGLAEAVANYAADFQRPAPVNDGQNQSHTWDEGMNSFIRYMSW
jgi:hypothetical protein